MNPQRRNIIYGFFGLLWLMTVLIGYFYTHKPFSFEAVMAVLLLMWRIGIGTVIISLAGGIGYRLLKGRATQPLSQTTIQAALGLGILSLATLLLGTVIGLNLWLFASLVTLGSVLLGRNLVYWWRSWCSLQYSWEEAGKFGKLVSVTTLIILFCTLLISLAPPLQFDALTYHLAIPSAYLQIGHVTYLPDNIFWGMPEQTEMLYTLAMLFGGNEAATFLGWAMGLVTLVGIFSYTSERLGKQAGWTALACLLAGHTFAASLAWGYVEWPSMLFGISMIIAMHQWLELRTSKTLLVAGMLAGMGLGTKYSAGILPLAGLVVILSEIKRLNFKATWKALLLFGVSAVMVILPWLLKNLLVTGNPFYPLLFPGGAMNQIRVEFYQKNSIGMPWYEIFILPWQATIWGVEGKVGYSASIGPLLLGFGALFWLGWRARPKIEKIAIRLVTIITSVGLVTWAIASQLAGLMVQSRLYFSMFPAWAVLGGVGFSAFSDLKYPGVRLGRIASALIVLVLCFSAFESFENMHQQNPVGVLTGIHSAEEYINNNLGAYATAMQTIRNLASSSRVLMLWETRSLECLPGCDPDEVIDSWFVAVHTHQTPEQILDDWRRQGYTHILLFRTGAEFIRKDEKKFTAHDWQMLESLLAKLSSPQTISGYELYSLKVSE